MSIKGQKLKRQIKTMAHNKTTGKKVASKAGKVLGSNVTSRNAKSIAASALSQKHKKK